MLLPRSGRSRGRFSIVACDARPQPGTPSVPTARAPEPEEPNACQAKPELRNSIVPPSTRYKRYWLATV